MAEAPGRPDAGIAQARAYQRGWLRWDALAGVTVAAYLVPQVMAYGALAGLDPVTGLWTCLPALSLYALFGSSRQLSVGPESTCALMTAVVVAPLAAGDPSRYAVLAAALAILVGLYSVVGWLLRLEFGLRAAERPDPARVHGRRRRHHDRRPARQGHRGLPVHGSTLLGERSPSCSTQLNAVQWRTVLIATVTLVFLFLLAWRAPRLPGPLLAVVLATVLTSVLSLDSKGAGAEGRRGAAVPDVADRGGRVPGLGGRAA